MVYEMDAVSAYPSKMNVNAQYGKGKTMATSEEMDLAVRVIANEIVSRFIPIEAIRGDNEYETACKRFENANTAYPLLHRLSEMIDEIANEEYDEAQSQLRECEKAPGIPLDKFNRNLA